MRTGPRSPFSTATWGTVLALALVAGARLAGDLAEADRPQPRRLSLAASRARLAGGPDATAPAGLARAVFGAG